MKVKCVSGGGWVGRRGIGNKEIKGMEKEFILYVLKICWGCFEEVNGNGLRVSRYRSRGGRFYFKS